MKKANPSPPAFFLRFFRWFCHPMLRNHIEGDLMELYYERVTRSGKRKADVKFIIDVLMLLRPSIVKPVKGYQHVNNYGMFKNYFKISVRTLLKNKVYSFINIAGLATGIAVSVLILIFVAHEYSYDRFHKNGEKIFRAEKQFSRDGRFSLYANPEFGPTIKEIDSHVVNFVRLYNSGRKVVKSDDQHRFFEERFIFSDPSFFSVFSFELVKGQSNLLTRPGTVVITENTASKYFGSDEAIGRVITYDKNYSFEVVAIAKNPPSNSSLQFDFIASFSTLLSMPAERDMILNNSSGFPTYLQLTSKTDLDAVNQSILKTTYTNKHVTYSLSPLFANHFNLNFEGTANTRYAFIFLCVALLILTLGLINYMNLTTARATTRAKEVGIRKVIGANQKSLSLQFYIESIVTSVISFLLAIGLVIFFKPTLLNVLQQQIDISFLTSQFFLGSIIALLIACVLLSGSYPALVLSRFKPVEVLKGKFSERGQGVWVRKTLTVFQFAASIGLIICTLVMQHQMNYLRSKKIGLHRDQVMVVPIDQLAAKTYQSLKTELRNQSGVQTVGMASIPLFKADLSGVSLVTSPASKERVGTKWIMIDEEFLNVLDIPWVEKPERPMAGNHLINETAVEAFGFGDKRTGYDFAMGDDSQGPNTKIVGVVKNFNYQSLRTKIEPLVLTVIPDSTVAISGDVMLYIRLDPHSNLNEKIATIKRTIDAHSGETPFSYYFLDDAFNELQKGEERLGKIFIVFTSIALGIACMGLFGLMTFTAERRTKEISIRKVLGASLTNIVSLLSADVIILLLISIAVGSPLAWFVMQQWLSNFFYKVEIPLWFLIASGATVIILSLVIILSHGLKVAIDNPSKNLKSE